MEVAVDTSVDFGPESALWPDADTGSGSADPRRHGPGGTSPNQEAGPVVQGDRKTRAGHV
jgi:hypothetical protein